MAENINEPPPFGESSLQLLNQSLQATDLDDIWLIHTAHSDSLMAIDNQWIRRESDRGFLMALKMSTMKVMSFFIKRLSPETSPHTMTIGLVDSSSFDCQLFPFFQTDHIFEDRIQLPTVDMRVDTEIVEALFTIKTNGTVVSSAAVDNNAIYYPFLLLNGSILDIRFTDTPPLTEPLVTIPKIFPTDDDQKYICSVCMAEPIGAVFDPCGHGKVCFECAIEVKNNDGHCPVCRESIRRVMKLFL